MRNNTLPRVAQVLGFILSMLLVPAVHALTLTLTGDCTNGTVASFNASTNTLTCTTTTGPTPPGTCNITSVPAAAIQSGVGVSAGTSVTLTAFCATGTPPITYSWDHSVTNAVAFNAPATQTTYTVTTSNISGAGPTLTATVFIASTNQGTAPGNCSIVQTPNTVASAVAAGTVVNLNMTCAGGNPATSCAWSNNIVAGCSGNVTAPSTNITYSATASNSFGTSTPATPTTIQVQTSTTGKNFCTGSDQIITVGWPASRQVRPGTSGLGNQTQAFKITIPLTFSPALNIAHMGFAHLIEVPGTPVTSRDFTVSKNSCDFQSGTYLYNDIGYGDTAPSINFTINNPNFSRAGADFNLSPGDTIYMNVRNANNGSPSCPAGGGACNVLFDFATPNRY